MCVYLSWNSWRLLGKVYWTWRVFHSSLHLLLEPFTTLVNIQQLLLKVSAERNVGLYAVTFTTVLSKWQLQQLDEIREALHYQHLWNNCPMGHSRWSLAILLTIQILLDVTLCYWVQSSQHSCVLHFFVIAILQSALNRTIHPSVCMYVWNNSWPQKSDESCLLGCFAV